MGATHFLTRTLNRVSTEMSLQVLAYNMKRVDRDPRDPQDTRRNPGVRR